MKEYHPFQRSMDPRKENSCQRCGRVPLAPCHISLTERVEGLREAYLASRIDVEAFATKLPSGWGEHVDDPSGDGTHLIHQIVDHLVEFQLGGCGEPRLRELIEATR